MHELVTTNVGGRDSDGCAAVSELQVDGWRPGNENDGLTRQGKSGADREAISARAFVIGGRYAYSGKVVCVCGVWRGGCDGTSSL